VAPLLEVDPKDVQRRVLRAALERVGVDPRRTHWDRPQVRVVEPLAPGEEGRSIGFHRDTWGSNVLAQINWWAPLEPLTAERTIAFYPGYWSRPIANSSADWDLDEVVERRRAGEEVQIVPEPTEPVDTSSELRVVIEPGDLLCFSGAHMHASVPNTSGERRVSLELRTLNLDDHEQGRGAPNLDGRAPRVPLHWFKPMADSA
jgi:ectoine hydroxylase-related dioxygenase (phytanoyl-CoA dioxygenase family)